MKVSRATDGGPLSVFAPPDPCTCYYLSKIPLAAAGAPTGCTACTSADQCAGGACSHGFCEPDSVATSGTSPGCFNGTPASNDEIINACSNAQHTEKPVTLPVGDPIALP
jgi:hypothetical protein